MLSNSTRKLLWFEIMMIDACTYTDVLQKTVPPNLH